MIDIEVDIFDKVARAVMDEFPEAFCSSVHVQAPASFPAVFVREISNVTATDRLDSDQREKASFVSYQVDVYSNLRLGARTQAKKISQLVDGLLVSMNFNRTYSAPTENPADSEVYRITMRYTALVDESNRIYRR